MTSPIDPGEIAKEVVRLAEQATPGPWLYVEGERVSHDAHGVDVWSVHRAVFSLSDPDGDGRASTVIDDAEDTSPADARLIAYCREAAPALARAYQDLLGEREGMRERVRSFEETADQAITLADSLLDRFGGPYVPAAWPKAIRRAAEARAKIAPPAPAQREAL